MNKIIVCAAAVLVLAGCQSKQANDNQSPSADQRREAARKLTTAALGQLNQKDVQGTVTDLSAAIKADPTDKEPYLLLGQILLKAQQYEQASELLDAAAKNFPDDGMVFYMLSVADKMAGKKMQAVMAARRSYDIFNAANDKDNAQRSAILLKEIVDAPDAPASK